MLEWLIGAGLVPVPEFSPKLMPNPDLLKQIRHPNTRLEYPSRVLRYPKINIFVIAYASDVDSADGDGDLANVVALVPQDGAFIAVPKPTLHGFWTVPSLR